MVFSNAPEELHSLLVTLSAPNWTLSHGCSEQHCGELFAEFVRRFLDVLFLLTRNFERLEQLVSSHFTLVFLFFLLFFFG